MSSYTQFVSKNFHTVQAKHDLTPTETISELAKMWRNRSKKSPSRRCSDKKVKECHRKKRVCKQNKAHTRSACRRSASRS